LIVVILSIVATYDPHRAQVHRRPRAGTPFGRAAQKCFVTQPTLSLALAKLEDELGLKLFERNKNEVLVTSRGQAIVEQARRVLDEVGKIPHLARGGQDQLAAPCTWA
jgi:LysR family hydrogen peroxide-inducible transcriptional activator